MGRDHPPDKRSRPVAANSGETITGCASVLSLESCSALCHHVAQINADLTDGLSPVSYDR
jgi:hypothetical protein